MAFTRRLGVIGILGASWLLAVACSDDGDKTSASGDAGEAGEATSGGKVSVGGSQSNAGKGGSATAGTAGKGGAATGGNGGTTASAGTAGSGGTGTVAGAGGEGGNAPSNAGAGGEGGALGGTGAQGGEAGAGGASEPAPVLKECGTQCEVSDDCAVIDSQTTFTCNQAHHCVADDVTSCQVADDCAPSQGFWTTCATSEDCDPETQRCGTWHGQGYCMLLPDCFPGDLPVTVVEFGNTDYMVDVCYTPGSCVDHACQPGCEFFGDGACVDSGSGDTCSPVTHSCTCAADGECSSGHCGADGACQECVTADDCGGAQFGLDTCVNGHCGCSAAGVCPDNTAAGTPVCE